MLDGRTIKVENIFFKLLATNVKIKDISELKNIDLQRIGYIITFSRKLSDNFGMPFIYLYGMNCNQTQID